MPTKLTQDTFLTRCHAAHGTRYDYSLSVYTIASAMVTIICPDHGPFEQRADAHMRGKGCRACANEIESKRTLLDLTGRRFGLLTVLRRKHDGKRMHWWCRCDCGTEKIVQSVALRSGSTKSCGCAKSELISAINTKHGKSGRADPTYTTWLAMYKRCNSPDESHAPRYRDRGISVCKEWRDFSTFYSDMGKRPKGKSLDRIDNDKGYCKENCRWATPREQSLNRCNNRMITAFGRTMTLSEWAKESGLFRSVIARRLDKGWAPEDAVSRPTK
jgi:hypothetical protein